VIPIDTEARRLEISKELNVPIEKVSVYPYKEPKGTEYPTPKQVENSSDFIRLEQEGIKCDTIYTNFEVIKRQEEVIEWLKNIPNGKKNK
jgi:hypothetical protein